jgi:hypothetical protein
MDFEFAMMLLKGQLKTLRGTGREKTGKKEGKGELFRMKRGHTPKRVMNRFKGMAGLEDVVEYEGDEDDAKIDRHEEKVKWSTTMANFGEEWDVDGEEDEEDGEETEKEKRRRRRKKRIEKKKVKKKGG